MLRAVGVDHLETALEVEAARAGSTTGEATSVLDAVPAPKRKLSGRGRWSWAAIAVLLLVGGGALAAVQLISSGIGGGGANVGEGAPISISSATDYDPQGDEAEGGEEVSLVADGDPTGSAWGTEHYETEDFAGTKTGPEPGVGVYVTVSSPARPTKMVVRSITPGWDASVYAASAGPPSDLSGWGEPVGQVTDAGQTEEIPLRVRQPSTYFLLWFTRVSESRDQPGRYQVEVSDIRLLG